MADAGERHVGCNRRHFVSDLQIHDGCVQCHALRCMCRQGVTWDEGKLPTRNGQLWPRLRTVKMPRFADCFDRTHASGLGSWQLPGSMRELDQQHEGKCCQHACVWKRIRFIICVACPPNQATDATPEELPLVVDFFRESDRHVLHKRQHPRKLSGLVVM